MSSLSVAFCALLFGFLVGNVFGGEYCTTDTSFGSVRSSFCEYGCCGSARDNDRECCEDGSTRTYIYVGGSVGGGIGFIILCVCLWFCCK